MSFCFLHSLSNICIYLFWFFFLNTLNEHDIYFWVSVLPYHCFSHCRPCCLLVELSGNALHIESSSVVERLRAAWPRFLRRPRDPQCNATKQQSCRRIQCCNTKEEHWLFSFFATTSTYTCVLKPKIYLLPSNCSRNCRILISYELLPCLLKLAVLQ